MQTRVPPLPTDIIKNGRRFPDDILKCILLNEKNINFDYDFLETGSN